MANERRAIRVCILRQRIAPWNQTDWHASVTDRSEGRKHRIVKATREGRWSKVKPCNGC